MHVRPASLVLLAVSGFSSAILCLVQAGIPGLAGAAAPPSWSASDFDREESLPGSIGRVACGRTELQERRPAVGCALGLPRIAPPGMEPGRGSRTDPRGRRGDAPWDRILSGARREHRAPRGPLIGSDDGGGRAHAHGRPVLRARPVPGLRTSGGVPGAGRRSRPIDLGWVPLSPATAESSAGWSVSCPGEPTIFAELRGESRRPMRVLPQPVRGVLRLLRIC
jgi:hypothetical protein